MLNKYFRVSLVIAIELSIQGCARLAFYSDENLKNETGVKIFTQKPYLLVANTGVKDKPVDISVQYISDLSKPIYVKPVSGISSAELTEQIANGTLTQFGQKTDTKIPELITALAGLGTSMATAGETFKRTDLLKPQGANFPEILRSSDAIIQDVQVNIERAKHAKILTSIEINTLNMIQQDLKECKLLLNNPIQAESNSTAASVKLDYVLKNWQGIGKPSDSISTPENSIRRNLDQLRLQIEHVKSLLVPTPPAAVEGPSFRLYEINNSSGSTQLIEVK